MTRIRLDSPCHGCTKRWMMCHAECKEYAEYVIHLKAKNDAIREAKAKDNDVRSFLVDQNKRVRSKQQAEWQKKYAERFKKG